MHLEVELYCPPMKIFKTDNPKLRVTDEEPMEFTGRLYDGRLLEDGLGEMLIDQFELKPVTIDPTYINKIGWLHWLVRACIGYGKQNGLEVISRLPAEDTRWSWTRFGIYAEKMLAPTSVRLPDGRTFDGIVTYPEVRLGVLNDMTVPELTATGTLKQVS